MIRGVPGIWYSCDMLASAQVEGRDGDKRLLVVPLVFPLGSTTGRSRTKPTELNGTRWDFAFAPGL